MPLDVVRLRDSDIAALSTGEEFRAAVLLWCASWHQVPAASLSDDDRVLSQLAGYGRVVAEWKKVRDGALRGWVKCADGRLYHPVVAEKANESWRAKHRHAYTKLEDRVRKQNKKRAEIGLVLLEIPDFDTWISIGFPTERDLFPTETPKPSPGISDRSAGIPPENVLKGEGQGQGYVNPYGGGIAQDSGSDHGPSDSPPAAAALLETLAAHGIDAAPDDPRVTAWVAAGVTPAMLVSAIAEARKRRAKAQSPQPVNVGFLDAIVGDVLAARATPSAATGMTTADWWRSWSGIVAKGTELDVTQRDDEPDMDFRLRVYRAAGNGPWWDELDRRFRNTAGPVKAGEILENGR
ncbi:DUF1376 domain-containing protein [Burkholderia sp. Bp9031]|nr:DUF1376 domain-containing protein [Burkholderia sp. Bp9031]